jgi:hypothetical protein
MCHMNNMSSYVLMYYHILPLYTMLLLDFGTVPTVWYSLFSMLLPLTIDRYYHLPLTIDRYYHLPLTIDRYYHLPLTIDSYYHLPLTINSYYHLPPSRKLILCISFQVSYAA